MQKQKFSCVTQPLKQYGLKFHLQKQKFSCVTQLLNGKFTQSQSAKAEIFLCYSTFIYLAILLNLQKQKFSCVTQQKCDSEYIIICKSRNFLVLLNTGTGKSATISAKAEIFLCYSTCAVSPSAVLYLQKQKFSCVTQPQLLSYFQPICKSRNFLVLLNLLHGQSKEAICKSRNFLVLLNS
mgnify:CR=1 FL=1